MTRHVALSLRLRALPLKSKAAPYSPHRESSVAGDNIGVVIENIATGRKVFYAPGLGEIEPQVWEAMQTADVVLVDGNFWTDDELICLGISSKTAREIGHLPQSGAAGMLACFERLPDATRTILIHINNTNPILDEDSPERAEVVRCGVEVAYDGMEITLSATMHGTAPNSRRLLRDKGKAYHIHHPFNVMLNTGKATPEQIRGWVANRFYYQIAIPGQGCSDHGQLPRPRNPPWLVPAYHRPRRNRRRCGSGSRRH